MFIIINIVIVFFIIFILYLVLFFLLYTGSPLSKNFFISLKGSLIFLFLTYTILQINPFPDKRIELKIYLGSILFINGVSYFMRIAGLTGKDYKTYPQLVYLSNLLSYHIYWSFLLDAIATGIFITLFGKSLIISYDNGYLTPVIITGIIVFLNRFYLANGLLKVFKYLIVNDFHIILFRRFHPTKSDVARQVIGPSLGSYGKVITIWDKHLEDAERGPNSDSEEILSEFGSMIEATNENWQDIIRTKIESTDCFVFYWPEMPTEHMLWEYSECITSNFDSNRFLIITYSQISKNIKELVIELNNNIIPYFIELEPKDGYLKTAYFNKSIFEYFNFLSKQRDVFPNISGFYRFFVSSLFLIPIFEGAYR